MTPDFLGDFLKYQIVIFGVIFFLNLDGNCIYVRACDSLVHLLEKKPLDAKDKIFLQRSQCGYR